MDNATTDPDNARELKAALAERIWVSICACEECEPFARAVLDHTNALAEDDLRFQTIAASYEGAAAEVIRDYFEFCVGVGGDVAWDLLRRRHVNLANASADEYITLTLLDALALTRATVASRAPRIGDPVETTRAGLSVGDDGRGVMRSVAAQEAVATLTIPWRPRLGERCAADDAVRVGVRSQGVAAGGRGRRRGPSSRASAVR